MLRSPAIGKFIGRPRGWLALCLLIFHSKSAKLQTTMNRYLLSAACLASGISAQAALINFTFEGVVTVVNDMTLQLNNSITNGTPVRGFYIFDPATEDSISDATVGQYRTANSACGVVVHVGNYVFRTNPRKVDFLIELVNRDTDHHVLRSYVNVANSPIPVGHIAWQLDDSTGTALAGTELPLTPPSLTSFPGGPGLTISGGCELETGFFIRANITAIEETPYIIPERPESMIEDAVAVSWPSRLGYFYQIQKSEDRFETWIDVGEPVLGDGSVLTRYFPSEKGKKSFYRAEIANFPN